LILEIARQRFPFPNQEKPSWHCYVNLPGKPLLGLTEGKEKIYPHILVVDRASAANKNVLAADVLTAADFSNLPLERWAKIVNAVNSFYLFVPEGFCQQIIEAVNNANIFVSGFRYYRQVGEQLEIDDCL
jgi:hypothetical protein